jgi:hypothetical protein
LIVLVMSMQNQAAPETGFAVEEQALRTREKGEDLRPGGSRPSDSPCLRTRRTNMDEDECGCSQLTSINELCPKCSFEYDEYLATMAMLRKSAAQSEPTEVEHADAA